MFGIQLAVHASFFLLLAFYAYEGWQEGGMPGAVWSVTLICLFFVCVVLHELGHSLTAMRYGVRVPRILLLPIGGMAELESIPRKPSAELLITIMGPAVNFVIAAILIPIVWSDLWTESDSVFSVRTLLPELAKWNLVMGVFNLLPVFPMDGGRVLRALLATRLDYLRATYWAALVGKILAAAFALVGFFVFEEPMLGILFVFIFFVGDLEYKQVLRREREAAYWADWSRRVSVPPPLPPRQADAP